MVKLRVLLLCALLTGIAFGSVAFAMPDAVVRAYAAGVAQDAAQHILRVSIHTPDDIARLTAGGWDVLEARGPDYLLVLGNDAVATALRQQGFTVAAEQGSPDLSAPAAIMVATNTQASTGTFANGYHTVEAHYQHLDNVAAAHPNLAVVVDYGDSWRKTQGRTDGHDLKAICITQLRPGDCALNSTTAKPRFVLMAAIHPRELTTAEIAWRWIDSLVDGYDRDAEVTALLQSSEMWVIPVANPDGLAIVAQGGDTPYLQRKNADDAQGDCRQPPTVDNQAGVDLNRNGGFEWTPPPANANPCAQSYEGLSAASEPETSALQQLLGQLFPDQRADTLNAPAPSTARGAMLSLHSYSNLVLLPWTWPDCSNQPCPANLHAPNDAGLRAFAFRLNFFNGYTAGQPTEILYPAPGTTDDWLYGTLGVASLTFEIGPARGPCSGFTPPYACQDIRFWRANRDALLYAAKLARQPYTLALGPSVIAPTVSSTTIVDGAPATLDALLDDGRLGTAGVGRPSTQTISAAEYYIDLPPWAGGTAHPMTAQDGAFTSLREEVDAPLDTHLAPGRHLLYVRGRDAAGNWGPVSALWLQIEALATAHAAP